MRIRALAIIATCLATSLMCKAQIGAYRNNFSIGFNGGYVLSNVGFNPRVDQGYHGGITGGMFVTCQRSISTPFAPSMPR